MTVACEPSLTGVPSWLYRNAPVASSVPCQPFTTSAADPGPRPATYSCSAANWRAIASLMDWLGVGSLGNCADLTSLGNSRSPPPSQFSALCNPPCSPVTSSITPGATSSGNRGADTVGSPINDDSADSEQSRQLFRRPSTSVPPSLMRSPYAFVRGSACTAYEPSGLRSAFSTAV